MVNSTKRQKDLELKPIHPGEILREELLIPLKISAKQLTKSTQIKEETIRNQVLPYQQIKTSLRARKRL